MTEHHVINPLSIGVDYASLAARFRPIFQRIAEGALEREHTRTLPHAPIQWLKEAGFGAVRVPVEYGGGGASLITVIGGKELLYAAQGIMNRTYEAMFPLCGVALVYLILVMLFTWLLTKFERRMAQGDR